MEFLPSHTTKPLFVGFEAAGAGGGWIGVASQTLPVHGVAREVLLVFLAVKGQQLPQHDRWVTFYCITNQGHRFQRASWLVGQVEGHL